MPLEAYYTHLSPTIFLRGGREMRESPGKRNRDFQPWSSEKIAVSGLFVLSEASSLRPNLTALAELFGFTNGSCQEVIWSTRTPHAEEPAGASHTPSANDAFLIRKWESAPPGNGGTGTSTFVSRGGEPMGAQKKNNNFTATGKQAYRALRRRGVAALLTLSMLLPIVPTSLAAGTGLLRPIQATPVDIDQDVQVEVEGNMVRDPYNRKILTGYYELGLRVRTPAGKSFRTLSLTLEYDSAHFTPVDWSDNDTPVDMTTNITKHYQKDMRAWSIGGVNDLDAFGGTPAVPDAPIDDPTAPTPAVDPNRAMMTFTVRANKAAELKFDDMTTIAVVRFKVHDDPNFVPTVPGETEDFLSRFSLKKNGPGDFSLCYDDDGPGPNAPTVVDTMEALQGKMGTNAKPLANAATDDDVDGSASDVNMSFDYMLWDDADETKSYEYYYVPGYKYDDTDPTTYDQVTTTINGQSYTLNRPKLKGDAILAVDPNKPDGDPDKYSYVSNLVTNDPVLQGGNPTGWYENINFTLVSKPSAIPGMDQAAQMATIVYLDWDNTIIGEQSAPADGKSILDVVNDYAATYLIYHDTDLVNYGPDDLYDPNDPANTDSPLDIVKSLERKYNYRGKYPYDAPHPEGTTAHTFTDGANYPLTNKLDYVFLKRPMERKSTLSQKPLPTDAAYQTPDGNNKTGAQHSQYIADLADWNTWEQKADTTGANPVAEYDTENPFAYGWALCTRSNYKNVWTTLGTAGELTYNGAATGGYNELNGAPGQIIFDPNGQSDEFIIADLEKGTTGPIYLKAIYEPGTELMLRTYNYRMISNPYYNKLNYGAASAGGAYSADVTFERATTEVKAGDTGNKVRGVARMRDPYVRQDVTTDLRWEEDATLGVNHDLTNADMNSAYTDKDKSTFIKVEVTNTDEVPFALTLSARQNKVDYYLIEAYGMNFVAGGTRTAKDNSRSESMATMDNYNYFVDGESDLTDKWYDAPYKDREGSRGFVLYGTLNQIMEQATKCYNGEMTVIQLMTTYATENVMKDMNIRKSDGTFAGLIDLQALVQTIVDAAGDAQTAHGGGNNDWWNPDKNCAQLTYHQLQNYILTYTPGTPHGHGTLLPAATEANQVTGLTWCHLHKTCADAGANKPTDWASLITAAGTQGTLGGMSLILNDLNTLAYLRKDANGTPFATLNEYITALEGAAAALGTNPTPSWDAVQAQIIGNGHTASDGPDKYWWYDSATTVTTLPKGSWSDLLDLAKDAVTAPVIPGETAATAQKRLAKLNQIEAIFDDNTYATDADTNWIAVTENLCKDNNGNKFATFSDFTDALTDALDAYAAAGTAAPDWYQVQYYILNGATAAPNGDAAAPAEYATYWWHNGGQKVKDLATLLKAARDANNGNSASLDALTVADLYNTANTELFFGKDYKGTRYTASNLDDFKDLVKSYVQAQGCNDTWDQLQYYIIASAAGTCDLTNTSTLVDVNKKQVYFWWKGNGAGTAVTFNTATKGNVADLLKAAYTSRVTGDPKAWNNLTDAIVKNYRIIKTKDSSTDFNDFPKFAAADLSTFKTYMEDLVDALITAAGQNTLPMPDLPTATWYQVQYAALNSGALVTGSNIPDNTVYWWLNGDTNIDPLTEFKKLLNNAYKRGTNAITIPQFQATITPDLLNAMGFTMPGNVAFTTANVAAVKPRLQNLYARANTMGLVDAANQTLNVTWYQVQWMIRTGALLAANVAKTNLNNQGVTAPAWATAAGYSLRPMMAPMLTAPRPQVTTEVSPDGLTETTTRTLRTWNEDTQSEDVEIMTVVVTKIVGETTTTIVTTTTITITTLDPETLQPVTAVDTDTEVETVPNTSSTYTGEDDTTLTDPDDVDDVDNITDSNTSGSNTGNDNNFTYSNKDDTTITGSDDDGDDGTSDNANTSGNTTRPAEGVGPYDKTDTNNSTYTNSGSSTAGSDSSTMGPDAPGGPSTDLTDSNGAPGGPSSTGSTYTQTPDVTPLTTTLATQKQEIPVANDLKIRYNKEENTHTPTTPTAAGSSGSGEGALGDVVPEGGDTVVKASNWEKGISTLARVLSATRLTAETGGQSIAQASWQELLAARRIPERAAEKASPGETTFVFLDSGQRWGPPLDPGGPPPSPFPDTLIARSGLNTAPIRRITHE